MAAEHFLVNKPLLFSSFASHVIHQIVTCVSDLSFSGVRRGSDMYSPHFPAIMAPAGCYKSLDLDLGSIIRIEVFWACCLMCSVLTSMSGAHLHRCVSTVVAVGSMPLGAVDSM